MPDHQQQVAQWAKKLPLHQPPISVKDVAMREALDAYVAGLYVSAILTAHAACEIFLAELVAFHNLLKQQADGGLRPERARQHFKAADKAARTPRRIEVLLDELAAVGRWVPPSIRPALMTLADHRQAVAHYRPIYKQGTLRVQAGPTGGWEGQFKPSELTDPQVLEDYAEQALATMVEVLTMPNVTYTPGQPPPDHLDPQQ